MEPAPVLSLLDAEESFHTASRRVSKGTGVAFDGAGITGVPLARGSGSMAARVAGM